MLRYLTCVCAAIALVACTKSSTSNVDKEFEVDVFKKELDEFLMRELGAYASEASVNNYRPDSIFGYPFGGNSNFNYLVWAFSSAADYGLSMSDSLDFTASAKKLLPSMDVNTVTFPQLFALKAFNHLKTLKINPDNYFADTLRDSLEQLLNPMRFIDTLTWLDNNGRPANYTAVALHVAAEGIHYGYDYAQTADSLFASCIRILRRSEGMMDDARNESGKYDRYLHEYARFVYSSAVLTGRSQIVEELKPMLINSFALWWDLYNPATGHSSPWGRSLQNSWDDTWENTAFLMKYPELSPASAEELIGAFKTAFDYWKKNEYDTLRHTNRMLDTCRGTYSYAGKDRIWQYSIGSLAKLTESAHIMFNHYKGSNQVSGLSKQVNRFAYYRNTEYKAGVWMHQSENGAYMALPLISADNNDYLPIPYGAKGLELQPGGKNPVLVPVFEADSGIDYRIAGQPDSIRFDVKNASLTAYWSRMKSGKELIDLPLTATWTLIEGNKLKSAYTLHTVPQYPIKSISTVFSSSVGGLYPQVKVNNIEVAAQIRPMSEGDCKGAFRPIVEISDYSYAITGSLPNGWLLFEWELPLN